MASRSLRRFVEQELGAFPHFLIYAILEWTLIALLFVHAIVAFLSREFAKLFELKLPCLLCTRIDCKNLSFHYNDSICESHKKDISSLAYCHIHRNLSNIKNLCERCLLSFTSEKGDNNAHESYDVSIDSLVEDDVKSRLRSTVEKGDGGEAKGLIQRCSCCGEAMKTRQKSSKNLGRSLSWMALGPTPSPRAPHIRYTELSPADDEYGLNLARIEEKCGSIPSLSESNDYIVEEVKTPISFRSKFFGIPLSDSATPSPRWARLSKKLQLDRADIASQLSGGAMEVVESDSILSHLKKQVKLDRKTLIEMYMELDEERSASAVAANNAMAMITRLQAEKAAVQMEALQYQRMMEEQAEYDEEDIQVMKELLTKREEEIKALEMELDTYREKYGPINRIAINECEVDNDDNYRELRSDEPVGDSPNAWDRLRERRSHGLSLGFEDERSYLLGLVAELERKLIGPSHDDCENQNTGVENKATLTREVSFMRERLRAIEADNGFLKHAAMTFQKGGEGTKLLAEIALHLRKLRQSPKVTSGDVDE